MADNEKDDIMEFEDEPVVVMTDEEGNEYYYREDMIVPVGDKRFAILVPIDVEEEGGEDSCSCGCGCDEETDVFIARIDVDEDGEEIYVDPTDEEFEAVRQAYEELVFEDEEE
ncbi:MULTISPECIES: DUF1292 domain-containing protein [Sporomusa]|jgi:uncharacterized protein YrzB (UPF0473 family)|uniref:Uncharacterized protein n=1 Tax=Sporomusa sphaeroides DSM 2875 TaxID=1337886 RepID=A0ABP2C713_9FIRM|nr:MULTISPECIES: DUF1292 domain-containing protein [Sporomusa]MCM0757234.1 DUF1292 domain-containing protein [Sporomusa sphaeroides DSM 2875]OLS58482.1 hypothetical protein SPSPH_20300 [Sporomusa sphaeroides DSM 2875]CVK19622.1 hypothetical protein SSPH_02277 [Sporomusa sphaeroides DSM 2875]HML34308.1 DUF1292 domain-containing protein [Sporomusa sphaeroides]